jgi:hypothetical protein
LFRKDGLNLRDVIKNSYSPKSELGSYMRDPELSGRDNRFILTKKINNYSSVAEHGSGTDIYNDLRLATGGLKNTIDLNPPIKRKDIRN